MLISSNAAGIGGEFSSSGCCPVVPTARAAVVNWKMDPTVGMAGAAQGGLPTGIPLSPTG